MGCRFPGGANDPQSFWELLRNGADAITEVPKERWNASRFYHPNSAAPGRMVTRWGGFVSNFDAFDAAFFGIAPREAARMDPQQRWLAEVTWEAMEDAGLPPEQLAGTRTGVFLGISACDYFNLLRQETHLFDGYSNIGNALCIAANRLSFLFDLRGPSFAVDTACSSSLVALHLAAQSLRSGECDYAVVAAANELLSPESSIGFSQARMLSPHGRSRAFDAAADGYVRAEGAGAVLLMPSRNARAMGLEARALLVGTASNQDGHTSSLTVPSQRAQEEMLREALRNADALATDVMYVEAHGTGTPVGDPIEARALATVLAPGRPPNERLLIGSVKTNIGHLESAAGMAGLIKAVLVLEHQGIPPNLHFTSANPQIPFEQLQVPTVFTPLPANHGHAPVVAVNSFGFGGTNAHALLAQAPHLNRAVNATEGACIFPISARSPAGLTSYANAFAEFIAGDSPSSFSLRDLCAAAALGKSHHPLRHALIADSLASLQMQLLALRESTAPALTGPPKIAFVFCGQGPQWWAMGRQLYESEKIVRDMWEQCDVLSRKLGGPNLLEALLADEASSQLSRTDIAQPALFALQAGLVELWRAWGIEADMVIGHSVGEAAAVWVAGIFDLEEIFRVIIARSRWQQKMHGLGRMLAAAISWDEAEAWAEKFGGRIGVAASNAPRQVTLSGEAGALGEIATALKDAEIFYRFLPADYAFHSAQMDPIEDGLRRELAHVAGREAQVPMISTVTGEPVRGTELNADYWWRNVRQPVRFAAGIERALSEGCTAFLEIGPHPVMAPALAEIALAEKSSALSVASLRRAEDEGGTMLNGLAALYRNGASVRWDALYPRPSRALRLPAYPWQRQRLWHESPQAAHALRDAPSHPLLGDRQPHPQPTWLNQLDTRLIPWLADHRLAGSAVLPAAAYLEMAAAAVREVLGEPTIYLEEIRFHHLLFLPEEQTIPTCVRLDPDAGSFQILAAPPDAPSAWELHAEGLYRPGRLRLPPPVDLELLRASVREDRDPPALYRELTAMGQIYGPLFQGLTSLRVSGIEEALSAIVDPAERTWPGYLLFPPSFDSCFHPGVALKRKNDTRAVVVASVRQVCVFQPLPDKVWSHLRIVERSENSYLGDLAIFGASGAVLAQIGGLKLQAIDSERPERERKFLHLAWEPSAITLDEKLPAGEVLIFAGAHGVGLSLGETLRARGLATTLVFANAKPHQANGRGMAVDLHQADWAIELWKTLAARNSTPVRIIFLWAFDDDSPAAARSCSAFLALAQARLAQEENEGACRWIVVTHRAQSVGEGDHITPAQAALWGFVRTVQTEQPHWNVSLVDCDENSLAERLRGELGAAEVEPEVALRESGRWVRRLRQFQPQSAAAVTRPPAFVMQIAQPGRADSIEFRGRARPAPGRGEVEVEIAAAALNFRDLMKVLGIYPLQEGERATLGDECSGRVARVGAGVRKFQPGDRVMLAALGAGAFASHLVISADLVAKIPETLSFADAAGIPVVFGTAYHALHTLARLRRGETVLIHAAAGGVGLAAVQLAQGIGATVLATAGSEEKRAHLRSLGVALVMDSRTLDFAEETLRFTRGRGVDVVLNSLAGAFQHKSLALCAPHGRFVEIGKRDLFENKGLPLAPFQRSLSFFTFDLPAVLGARGREKVALRKFFFDGFARGKLQPIPCTTFAARDAIPAFRLMQSANYIGKIVLEFDAERAPEVAPEFWPNPGGTYLITGGLSGFGLATARWLGERGTMHLALLSRRGAPSAQDAPALSEMRARGISVALIAADVADENALAAALCELKKSAPPLRGVFHAAMVLRDRTLAEMTQGDLEAVLAPKMAGAWNLHLQTRDLPLDCFVLYSSLSSLIGSPGQANYAAANAFLDALAHHRRAEGLPALSVNWGQISDVGVVADQAEIGRYLEGIGVRGLSSRDALATLPRLIGSTAAQAGVMNVEWEKLAQVSAKFITSPVFRDLVQTTCTNRGDAADEWRSRILRLSPEEQAAAVFELVIAQLAATFGAPPETIERHRPLAELGLDSLMAVELRARIETHAGCDLPMNLFNANLTAERLAERFLQRLQKADAAETKEVVQALAPTVSKAKSEKISTTLRNAPAPLADLLRAGKLAPLTAAALMPWPGIVVEQLHLAPEAFFQRMSGGRVSLDLILETPLGAVGIFMLPLTAAQVNPGEAALLPHLLDGIAQASACGARCVALTGLIPSATNYGAAVQAACESERELAALTTGHATTIAAVVLNLAGLLREAGRELAGESVLFYGIGSIGLGALKLMLDVLPEPAELRLCDPYRSAQFFMDLEETLRRESRYGGSIRVVGEGGASEEDFREVSVIVGATNVENVIDVTQLAPGTLIVDDSWPHCMNGPAARARFSEQKDILYTEGGFVRARAPMPRTTYLPPAIATSLPPELQLLFAGLNPHDITACILSALLSAIRPELRPTIGLIGATEARQHWSALSDLGFTAAGLNFEGASLEPELIVGFRERFGKKSDAALPLVRTR